MNNETTASALPGAKLTNSATVAQGQDMQVRKATISKGGGIPLHKHPFGQSHVIVKGEGYYLDGDQKIPVKAGYHNYAAAGVVHGWENPDSEELVLITSSTGVIGADEEKWNIHYQQ